MKKIISFILVVSVISAFSPHGYAANVIFTSVNDTFLELKDSTMPIIKNAEVYIPYSVFSNGLGLKYAYSMKERVLVLYNSDCILTFDLEGRYSYDQRMRTYVEYAFSYNGTVYVPAEFVCKIMDFHYSYVYTNSGFVVRLNNKAPSLSDENFVTIGEPIMKSMLKEHPEASKPNKPETPAEEEHTQQLSPKNLCLSFYGPFDSNADVILDKLDNAGISAVFFFTGEDLRKNADLIRKTFVMGHTIGLDSELLKNPALIKSPGALSKSLEDKNRLLDKILKTKTHIVLIPRQNELKISEKQRDEVVNSGFRLWNCTHRTSGGSASSSISSSVISAFEKNNGTTVITLPSNNKTVAALNKILKYIKANNIIVLQINDFNPPYNSYNDGR